MTTTAHVDIGQLVELARQLLPALPGGAEISLVGSALHKAEPRDVDVVAILPDRAFADFFNLEVEAWRVQGLTGEWSVARYGWSDDCCEISLRWTVVTSRVVDFKIQPRSWSDKQHCGEPRLLLASSPPGQAQPERAAPQRLTTYTVTWFRLVDPSESLVCHGLTADRLVRRLRAALRATSGPVALREVVAECGECHSPAGHKPDCSRRGREEMRNDRRTNRSGQGHLPNR